MKFAGHMLALLLATALSLGISNYVLSQTIWSAPYLEKAADKTQLYDHLATGIPGTFAAANPGQPGNKLPILDPALIKTQITTLLPQFIDHLHNGGPVPSVDLAALAAATGQQPPQGATTAPISLGPADPQVVALNHELRPYGDFAFLGALVMALLIIGVMRERRLPTLARAAFETGGALAISAGLAWFIPSLFMQALSKPEMVPIRDAVAPFLAAAGQGIALWFGTAAAAMLVLSIALMAAHSAGRLKARFTKTPKSAKTPFPGLSRS